MKRFSLSFPAFILAFLPPAAPAEVLDAVDSGWFSPTQHIGQNENYVVGNVDSVERRNFFIFDLGGVTGEITGATLSLYNPDSDLAFLKGYVSPDPTETYTLFDVTTATSTLKLSQVGAAAAAVFDDLGAGTILGQVTLSSADNGTTVSIVLDGDALAALNAARGGEFAIGGALTTLGGAAEERAFGFAELLDNPSVRRLDLTVTATPVPEPATVLLLLGGAGLFLRRRR